FEPGGEGTSVPVALRAAASWRRRVWSAPRPPSASRTSRSWRGRPDRAARAGPRRGGTVALADAGWVYGRGRPLRPGASRRRAHGIEKSPHPRTSKTRPAEDRRRARTGAPGRGEYHAFGLP